ncbi:hypothetical protein VN97_g11237 [Penicillium thymicola]|uniref:BED-type domain-containing protein n=1 Tax=Penicillium thymicola TaxID=293382 RepID=A0AAI9T7H1_PENTH|nr:hypothetical protein VN97_g11237 [Penicillium thymicola]
MSHSDWVEWWLQTDYGSKSKISWDSNHLSDVWKHYVQVAHSVDGAAKVMCERCSAILEHPYTIKKDINGKDGHHGTTTMTRHLKTSSCVRAAGVNQQKGAISKFIPKTDIPSDTVFIQEDWEHDILQFITLKRLPFHLIEHYTFQRLISKARSAPTDPKLPSADTIRRRLSAQVKKQQQSTLEMLPANSKISIALDCWTSPFGQAFMAITGYFIDMNWVYREVLLGFKPLYGAHTGANMSGILLETLVDHNIQDRIFGLTTDNASNNKTLVDSLQQALPPEVKIIRTPCLAHVIQLSLNRLLDRLKAVPLNDTTETKWTDRQSALAKANAQTQNREISHTLNKVRYLAVYIRASPQRRDAFTKLQPLEQGLMPIQDVRTRWNSTFLMLRRAKRLRDFFRTFCTDYNCKEMALDTEEWRQIDYLLYITKPFFDYTLALSKTRDVTAHLVLRIYNMLFEHLEKSITQLKRKRVLWKQQMLTSLEAGREKLDKYYAQTDEVRGHIYTISTMLAPDSRFQFFLSDDWDRHWRDTYRTSFREALVPYQERLASSQGPEGSSIEVRQSSSLHNLLSGHKPRAKPAGDEITQYLDGDIADSEPLAFWRDQQGRFPAITLLARDILSIPATGAGVERLFNTARDICHYRRGRMKSETIQELMMYLYEIEALREEKDEKLEDVEIDSISDTEEHTGVSEDLIDIDTDADEETNAGPIAPQLPETTPMLRTSGRKRKITVGDEFESY